MDAIGMIPPVIVQSVPASTGQDNAADMPVILPSVDTTGNNGSADVQAGEQGANQPNVDVQAADQKRLAAVQQMSQSVANIYVVSDQRFTIFKDATGQYITRFTSLRDGKVTYVPEPQLVKLSGSDTGAALNIKA